ncbi:hypothetical protein TNCV_1776141 [Trichonephila clavipes]|nr:hypothetical protein TNCV_1776141 [Trichonephila clavipes]
MELLTPKLTDALSAPYAVTLLHGSRDLSKTSHKRSLIDVESSNESSWSSLAVRCFLVFHFGTHIHDHDSDTNNRNRIYPQQEQLGTDSDSPVPSPSELEGKSGRGRSSPNRTEPRWLWLRNPIHMHTRVQTM